MFADQIRSANTEHQIYFLLTSYLESVPFNGDLHWNIPEHVTRLPVYGRADIRSRFDQLMLELDLASKRIDDESCAAIRQGVYVFGFALNRLDMLHANHAWQGSDPAVGWNVQAA
jgi:hypothetical protein